MLVTLKSAALYLDIMFYVDQLVSLLIPGKNRIRASSPFKAHTPPLTFALDTTYLPWMTVTGYHHLQSLLAASEFFNSFRGYHAR